MERLTAVRCNGIKMGYWSPKTKEEVVQRLGEYEDSGYTPEQVRKSVRDWIPTSERLPRIGEVVIVARIKEIDKPMKVEQAILQSGGWWKVYGTNIKKVSYWMPLPAPPEE